MNISDSDQVAELAVALSHARAAEGKRDWAEARLRWQQVLERWPGRVDSFLGIALALCELRDFDSADAHLEAALTVFHNDRRVLEAYAIVAQVRRDWSAAITRWNVLLERFPAHGTAHQGRILAMREAKFFDEADAAVVAAEATVPPSTGLLAEKARLAAARGDWSKAMQTWEQASKHAPDQPTPIAERVEILFRLKRFDEAETLLDQAIPRFPQSAELGVCHARLANLRKEWGEARDRWARLEVRFPENPWVLTGFAEALWALRHEVALVPVLDRLLVIQPNNVAAAILYARYEMRRNRAADAVARLLAASERSPNNLQINATLNDARLQALMESTGGETNTQPAKAVPQEALKASEENLFAQFQSLGSGCEFGLLQRQFGAEPLDLLRWASITPRGLIRLLECRFEGIGSMATTSIKPEGGNYALTDGLFDMQMQTFIATSTETAETLLPKLCRRQIYLANKMKESLAEADRIAVYKAAYPIEDEDIQRLARALALYGNNMLLVVRLADADHPPGSLEAGPNSVLLGYIDRFSNVDISVEAWTSVCRQASEMSAVLREHRQMLSACNAWD
jgi:tetratricopeptide (TPR) repeat protein